VTEPSLGNSATVANLLAQESLRGLLEDASIPPDVRREMSDEFAALEAMLRKLELGELHIAVFGRVSVGKSALLNALTGKALFAVSVLHGTTQKRASALLQEFAVDGVHVIDTPGINEIDGEARERLAREVAARADLVLFVVDGDLTANEHESLAQLAESGRPMLLVLNKQDRYSTLERNQLLHSLRQHVAGKIRAEHVLAVSAAPAERVQIQLQPDGTEREVRVQPAADIAALKTAIANLMGKEGGLLAAVNAGWLAGELSDRLGQRIAEVRRELADRLIRSYALGKGLAVGLNPIPVADLLSAAGLDVALVLHLSKLYGLPMTRVEAGQLVAKIALQLAGLMGGIWGVHLVSSALKTASFGLSTALTVGAQGALAYYATFITGRAAQTYLIHGKSWGDKGPKRMVVEVLDSIDRDSILADAREQILRKLKPAGD